MSFGPPQNKGIHVLELEMLIHQLCWMKAETVVGITAHVKNDADIKCTKLFTDCVTSLPWQRIQWATVLIFGRGRL